MTSLLTLAWKRAGNRLIMEKWELEAAKVPVKIMLLADYPATLTQLGYISQAVLTRGLFTQEVAGFLVVLVLLRIFFGYLRGMRSQCTRFWVIFGLYEVGQLSMVVAVSQDSQESLPIHIINSTVLLMLGEINPTHSLCFNSLLVTKHIALWVWVGQCRGVTGEVFSIVPVMWCFWNLLHAQTYRRGLLIAKQKAEEDKAVEEQRLKALLSALPDGVVVLSEEMEILQLNSAVFRQFELECVANPSLTLAVLIEKLCYDADYRNEEEGVGTFGTDVRGLLREKEGAVGNFKPVLYQGKHLECRGCIAMWAQEKVLILTIRDTSNWAQLEKAAKRDSANKTALIRSVSHELRTPVNAIINLCQDLQTSTSIGERDRADVEVLANASNFLLSMINDLLDYSRILHDKFELTKANFDLERLIRSCGQLIALQCQQKRVQLMVRYDPLLPKFAYTDENRLKQVILNLLSNAAK